MQINFLGNIGASKVNQTGPGPLKALHDSKRAELGAYGTAG